MTINILLITLTAISIALPFFMYSKQWEKIPEQIKGRKKRTLIYAHAVFALIIANPTICIQIFLTPVSHVSNSMMQASMLWFSLMVGGIEWWVLHVKILKENPKFYNKGLIAIASLFLFIPVITLAQLLVYGAK